MIKVLFNISCEFDDQIIIKKNCMRYKTMTTTLNNLKC